MAGEGLKVRCSERVQQTFLIRCAYCHAPLDAEANTTCAGCSTKLHTECLDDWGRCPTLGCRLRFPLRKHLRRRIVLGTPDPTRAQRRWRIWWGVVLPILAFAGSEAGMTAPLLPEWDNGTARAWWGFFFSPQAQRPFYPLLAWAMAAHLAATCRGSRARWVEMGLMGGVVLSLLFCVLFLPILPVSLGLAVVGVGLLGLSPFAALGSYARALGRLYRARSEAGEIGDDDTESTAWQLRGVWTVLGVVAARLAHSEVNAMHQALTAINPDCYLATVASRGDPRLTRAEAVTFETGVSAPVSRQLRVFKTFELALRAWAPGAHSAMRWIYDRAGPPLARRLGRGGASAAYLALAPIAWLAEGILRLLYVDAPQLIEGAYRPPSPTRSRAGEPTP